MECKMYRYVTKKAAFEKEVYSSICKSEIKLVNLDMISIYNKKFLIIYFVYYILWVNIKLN